MEATKTEQILKGQGEQILIPFCYDPTSDELKTE